MRRHSREIGGEFWSEDLPDESNGFFADLGCETKPLLSGRVALRYVLEDLRLRGGQKKAFLPAYTCQTVIEPFEAAGYQIFFYDIDPRSGLSPAFDTSMAQGPGVLLLHGYFGFPQTNGAFLRGCADRGVTVIQDITHTIFSQGGVPAAGADYLVASLRKWFGVPSGGLAVCVKSRFTARAENTDGEYVHIRQAAMQKKRDYINGVGSEKESFLRLFLEGENRLSQIFSLQSADKQSEEIISRFPVCGMIERRRDNFRYLLENLPLGGDIKPVFNCLPDGVCPLFFPVVSPRRDGIRAGLVAEDIYPPVHWPVPRQIDLPSYPGAADVYKTILSIPCDQRYDEKDMNRITEVFIKCLRS